MREVDNKIGFGNVQLPKTDAKAKPEEVTAQAVAEEVQPSSTKDLNSGAAVGGRSQVPESGQAAALEKAVNFAVRYPEKIKAADRFFDKTYKKLVKEGKSPEEAYSLAANMEQVFVDEFPDFIAK